MKKIIFSFTALSFLFSIYACNNDDELTTENCKLQTVTNYDGDDGEEPMQITYNNNNQIVQLLGNSLKYVYEYDNQGKISIKYYYEIGQGPNDTIKVIYNYNSDNSLDSETYYILNSGTYEQETRLKYHYTNGKVSTTNLYVTDNGIETQDGTATYTYTGNNITKIEYDGDDADTIPNYSYEFSIDTTKNNPFINLSTLFYTLDTYIDNDADNFVSYALMKNTNRVTAITSTETGFSPSTESINYYFTTSPQGNSLLNEVKIDNTNYYKFGYQCN